MSVTYSVNLDSNLLFTIGTTRVADNDPLLFTAPSGVEVTIQITAPMSFRASHDEKGKSITWKTVPTTDGSCIMAWSFPCPRSPFALTVSTGSASGTAAGTTKTKKVRIEAGATGGARGHAVQAPGHQDE
jgi:hypothetical protein